MRNYFKKFIIMFVMAVMLVFGASISAFADDSYVVGTANLNNTVENSAKVGDILKNPEKGWKRYDDSNNKFIYKGSGWRKDNNSNTYNAGHHYCSIPSSVTFKFFGSNFRFIAHRYKNINNYYSDHVYIKIDGIECGDFSEQINGEIYQLLLYQNNSLTKGIHTVELYTTNLGLNFDAIDINNDGYLIDSNESISLDKSTMNLNVGNSEQLTAITTPSAVGVTWTVSDPSIATIEVDPTNGKITKINALKEGTCTITATTNDEYKLSASCTINVTKKTEPIPTPDPQPTDTDYITNIAHAKGTNTNNPGGEVTIIFHGSSDTTLSLVKTTDVKDVWIGDNFTYTLVITNTGTKTAKAIVVNDPAPNHIDFNVSGVTTTQGTVDSSSTSKNIIVNVGDILPGGTVTIKIPSTVIA
ncbi:Ig-like domain-containing protein [Clostridium saccharoperbutylacetonicum]|uniref:Ig-like domain-containing protein n=1 Tax=Clostridium saccharoperbutylacetonicum TaxID=36745 RepID=UPI000983F2F6|nr:Ig-like domain-containing protein [Clostridium saccharoperbutylacetonicum]AQR95200.1 bacterial Ig-like domain protein [Clostridium saccharoperbutylacetonicum]NSB31054.1 putative repeat protein (TIGR01451 family) [Clostridium saccharoperbutylacetonicum]